MLPRHPMRRILAVVLFASLSVAALAHACSLAPAPLVTGWLGLTWDGEPATTPPANVASLVPFDLADMVVHGGIELWRAQPGLDAIVAFGRTIPLGTHLDETAPAQPVIRDATMSFHEERGGCGYYSSCGDLTTFDLDIEASDDTSPRGALTFAVWRSRSREVAPTRAPDYYLMADRYRSTGDRPDLWNFETNDWKGRDAWVVVRVLDQAGNVSPFSDPFLVDTGSRGCAVSSAHTGVALPLALALVWVTRRRRRNA